MENGEVFLLILVYATPLFLLLFCGVFLGGLAERSHLKRLDERERELAGILLCNLKRVPGEEGVTRSHLVLGQVVIATDYFKSLATALRSLVGGELRAANSLMTRGRREAVVRLLEEARRHGCNEVYNLRFGFSNISQMRGKRGAMQVEILAWGTAVQRGA